MDHSLPGFWIWYEMFGNVWEIILLGYIQSLCDCTLWIGLLAVAGAKWPFQVSLKWRGGYRRVCHCMGRGATWPRVSARFISYSKCLRGTGGWSQLRAHSSGLSLRYFLFPLDGIPRVTVGSEQHLLVFSLLNLSGRFKVSSSCTQYQ